MMIALRAEGASVINQKIKERVGKLIGEYPSLMGVDENEWANEPALCRSWVVAAEHVAALVVAGGPYRNAINRAIATMQPNVPHLVVETIAHTLARLLEDINDGLITNIENETRAETFDDLLDHAESYLKEGRKEPAGAVAGVVFEDTLRRLCRANGINGDEGTCEPLINALTGAQILTKLENKEAKACADLRASATHAKWDNFNDEQVAIVINFTRRLIREKLAG